MDVGVWFAVVVAVLLGVAGCVLSPVVWDIDYSPRCDRGYSQGAAPGPKSQRGPHEVRNLNRNGS